MQNGKSPLVIVSGFGANDAAMSGFVDFARDYFNPICIELPGFTTTARPLQTVSFDAFARYVEYKILKLQLERYFIAGISLTVVEVFKERRDVERLINELQLEGYDPSDIPIVMKDQAQGEEIGEDTGVNVAGGAVTGATTGAVVGGIAGLLGVLAIPGIGPFLIGGPIAIALGLTGAAASTVTGATTGAVAGGLIGALMGLGVSADEAKSYENRLKEGGILLAVPVQQAEESLLQERFVSHDAMDISVVESDDMGLEVDEEISDEVDYTLVEEPQNVHMSSKGGQSEVDTSPSGDQNLGTKHREMKSKSPVRNRK